MSLCSNRAIIVSDAVATVQWAPSSKTGLIRQRARRNVPEGFIPYQLCRFSDKDLG